MGDRLLAQLLTDRRLGHRTAPFLLPRLGVHLLLGLGHPGEAHRQTHSLAARQGGQEVEPFAPPLLGVVVMPTDPSGLVGVRFLLERVVEDQHPGLGLDLPDKRLDGPPQVGRRFRRARQVAGPLLRADFPLQPVAQSGGGGRPTRSQQVIGIQIGYRVCFHIGEFTPFLLLSRKVSYY